MKRIGLLLTISISSIITIGQKSQVIPDSADNKSTIYTKTLLWLANTWKGSNKDIDLKDSSGTILAKVVLGAKPLTRVPLTKEFTPMDGYTKTMMTILIRNGKAKLIFDDIRFEFSDELINDNLIRGTVWNYNDNINDSRKKSFDRWIADVDNEIQLLTDSYRKVLINKPDDF